MKGAIVSYYSEWLLKKGSKGKVGRSYESPWIREVDQLITAGKDVHDFRGRIAEWGEDLSGLFPAPGGFDRGNSYGHDFIRLLQQIIDFILLDHPRFNQEFHPVCRFLGFFFHNTHFSNKIRKRLRTAGRRVIGAN